MVTQQLFRAEDLFVDDDGDGFDEVFFLDRFFNRDVAPNVNAQSGENCVDVTFDTANKPNF